MSEYNKQCTDIIAEEAKNAICELIEKQHQYQYFPFAWCCRE